VPTSPPAPQPAQVAGLPGAPPRPPERDPAGTPRERDPAGTPRERGLALALLLTAVVLRVLGVWEIRFNSDEPQHAHVVWGWTRGLLQYRDFFDNHAPLFHMAWAPLLAAFGESVRTLFWLRLTMLPLYLAALAVTYAIGKRLLSPRAALWGTVLTALLPPFFVKTLEFRTDVPWTLLWLAAFQVATGGAPGPARLLATGLLVGAAAAVSLKSSLLLVCLLGSALVTAAWRISGHGGRRGASDAPDGADPDESGDHGGRSSAGSSGDRREHGRGGDLSAIARGQLSGASRVLGAAAAGLAGLAAIPAAVAFYFWRRGALDALLAGAVRHNLQVSQHGPAPLKRLLILVVGLPLLAVIARWSLRAGPPALARQRLLLALTTGSYLIALEVFWPLITSQTYLPVEPLLCLLVGAAAIPAPRAAGDPRRALAPTAPPGQDRSLARWPWRLSPGRAFLALAVAVELVIDVLHGPVRGDHTAPATAIVAAALRLTGPDEAVFDDKGDAVFRRRAFLPVLEDITREAMTEGRIADTIPESILAAHACLATLDSRRLPPRGKRFLDANFLPVGAVRVCGKWLPRPASPAPPYPALRFAVEIPARYAIVARDGPARGRLDGIELAMAAPATVPSPGRDLGVGTHVFEPASPPPYALVWAPAVERGFSPFQPFPPVPPLPQDSPGRRRP